MLSTLPLEKRWTARRIFHIAALVVATCLPGCRAPDAVERDGSASVSAKSKRDDGPGLRDVSGLAHYHGNLFLVVHDTDRESDRPRIGALAVKKKSPPAYRPLDVDWTRVGGVPDDLESMCPIPGVSNEFLVVESGDGDKRPARAIRLWLTGMRLTDVRAQVAGKIDLPEDVRNIEGSTLIPGPDGKLVLVLCERDEQGDESERHTLLLWAGIDLDGYRLDEPLHRTAVHAPVWPVGPAKVRTCSDLFYEAEADGGPRLWIAATADPGGVGPYQSIVYEARVAQHDLARPEGLTMRAAWRVDGFKVEGLAAPLLPGAGLSMVTDEDSLGGVFRALPPPTFPDDGGR